MFLECDTQVHILLVIFVDLQVKGLIRLQLTGQRSLTILI